MQFGSDPGLQQEKKKPKKGHLLRNTALAFIGFGAVTAANEGANVGQHEASVSERYQATLRRARIAYERRTDREQTYEQFLEENQIPTEQEIQALERLIAEFERPVRIRSGFAIMRTLAGGFEGRASYTESFTGPEEHNIYLPGREGEIFDREAVRAVISELAHAFQSEQGRTNVLLSEKLRNLFDVLSGRQHVDIYDRPGSIEHDAHTITEPELVRHYARLRDDYRAYIRDSVLKYAESGDFTPFHAWEGRGERPRAPQDIRNVFTFDKFQQFIRRIEVESNPQNTDRRSSDHAMMIGRALEDYLPSFQAEIADDGQNNRTLRIAVTRELYEEFIALTSRYEPLEGISSELVIPQGEINTLDIFDEYSRERENYHYQREFIFGTMSDLDIPDEEMDRLREESRRRGTSFEVDFIAVNDRYMRERAQRPFTFAEYQALAERIRVYTEGQEENGLTEDDIYLTDSAGSLQTMRQFFNDVCRFEATCNGDYGIERTASGRVSMRISEDETGEHYQTVKRLYEESRRRMLEQH